MSETTPPNVDITAFCYAIRTISLHQPNIKTGMKTIFDNATTQELVGRINKVDSAGKPNWGKMNAYQMIKHCRLWDEMIAGTLPTKRVFIGRIFGRMGLKAVLKNDAPLGRNAPTAPEVAVKEATGNFAGEKAKLITLVEQHKNFSNHDFVHPFFGKMTKEQIGQFAYKHIDHHLRQFNV